MKIIWSMAIFVLMLILCLGWVQAQFINSTSIYPSGISNPDYSETQSDVSRYSQFYTIPTGQFTETHIMAPEAFDLKENTPNDLYLALPSNKLYLTLNIRPMLLTLGTMSCGFKDQQAGRNMQWFPKGLFYH